MLDIALGSAAAALLFGAGFYENGHLPSLSLRSSFGVSDPCLESMSAFICFTFLLRAIAKQLDVRGGIDARFVFFTYFSFGLLRVSIAKNRGGPDCIRIYPCSPFLGR